jgi:hydrogenase expression/formation protein HypE
MTHTRKITAVLFDFDGTLTRPGAIDFTGVKHAVGCPESTPVLEFIQSIGPGSARACARNILDRFEMGAAENCRPNSGAEALITFLKEKGIKIGIISRNSDMSIRRALENFPTITAKDFDIIISRDTPAAPKPSPEGVLLAARELQTDVGHLLMVGDYLFDIQAGEQAGAVTVLLDNGSPPAFSTRSSNHIISKLEELEEIVLWTE